MLCLEAAKTEARKMSLVDMARIALAVLLGCTLCLFGRLAVEMISANKKERSAGLIGLVIFAALLLVTLSVADLVHVGDWISTARQPG